MIKTTLKQKNVILFISALLLSNVAVATPIAFQDPATAAWGGWSRGDASTSYVHWAHIDSLSDESPDAGNLGTSFAGLYANNGGAFLTGGGAGGNVYSFSDTPDFSVEFETDYAAPSTVTVALQLKILGTDLDSSQVTLGGMAWDSTETLFSGSAGGPFGGASKEYLFVWENVSGDTDYYLDFTATGSSMSLDEVSVDIAPSAVPLPAAAWMFLTALSGLSIVRRKKNI